MNARYAKKIRKQCNRKTKEAMTGVLQGLQSLALHKRIWYAWKIIIRSL